MPGVGLWRLKGARFRRGDGNWVQPGEVFQPTQIELARRRGKLEYVGPAPEPVVDTALEPDFVSEEDAGGDED